MSHLKGHHNATFYVQVEPIWSWRPGASGERAVIGAKVVRTSQRRPNSPLGGTVLVKLTIRVPDTAFLPLRPEAVVVIPEDLAVTNPVVEVEAGDPS